MKLTPFATNMTLEGSGPPLVVVHGGPGLTSQSVKAVSGLLSQRYCVVRYEQRGAYGTIGPGQKLTVHDFVEQIEALRCRLRRDRLILLGHSWGAGLVGLYAYAYAERVAALLLVHPLEISSSYCDRALITLQQRRPECDRQRLKQIAAELRSPSITAHHRSILELEQVRLDLRLSCADFPAGKVINNSYIDRYDGAVAEMVWKDLKQAWPGRDKRGYDLTAVFESIRVPALIILGDHDAIDMRSGARMAELMKARLVHFHHSGHWSFLEEPQHFQNAVFEFLDQLGEETLLGKEHSARHHLAKRAVAAGAK